MPDAILVYKFHARANCYVVTSMEDDQPEWVVSRRDWNTLIPLTEPKDLSYGTVYWV